VYWRCAYVAFPALKLPSSLSLRRLKYQTLNLASSVRVFYVSALH
jgi:hypothetical protein